MTTPAARDHELRSRLADLLDEHPSREWSTALTQTLVSLLELNKEVGGLLTGPATVLQLVKGGDEV